MNVLKCPTDVKLPFIILHSNINLPAQVLLMKDKCVLIFFPFNILEDYWTPQTCWQYGNIWKGNIYSKYSINNKFKFNTFFLNLVPGIGSNFLISSKIYQFILRDHRTIIVQVDKNTGYVAILKLVLYFLFELYFLNLSHHTKIMFGIKCTFLCGL
jgi:hypothetical protein